MYVSVVNYIIDQPYVVYDASASYKSGLVGVDYFFNDLISTGSKQTAKNLVVNIEYRNRAVVIWVVKVKIWVLR